MEEQETLVVRWIQFCSQSGLKQGSQVSWVQRYSLIITSQEGLQIEMFCQKENMILVICEAEQEYYKFKDRVGCRVSSRPTWNT